MHRGKQLSSFRPKIDVSPKHRTPTRKVINRKIGIGLGLGLE